LLLLPLSQTAKEKERASNIKKKEEADREI